MIRRLVLSAVLTALLALPLAGATRWVTDREGGPVRWEAWGERAFQRAAREQRPVFLSIGFAAPYECYRMHREAFINGENAEALNSYFVPVLLDRLEYPEIAEAYESALFLMTGKRGWPANLLLTPSLAPFAGGTFMTAPELNRLLVIGANRWADERPKVLADAAETAQRAREAGEGRAPLAVDRKTLDAVVEAIGATYHAQGGGFGEFPRTPHAMTISFLLRHSARVGDDGLRALAVAELERLAASAQRDQLGGGFHRAIDGNEPRFEKLLSDQALLAIAATEAWQITRDPDCEQIARTTIDYVLRDLWNGRKGFDAAQDAQSLVPGQGPEFVNGAFYRWNRDEITRLTGREQAAKIFEVLGIRQERDNLPSLADARFLAELRGPLAEPLAKMLEVRQKRPAPFREFTMIAAPNALMISALSRAGAAFGEPRYLEAASAAAAHVVTKLWNPATKTLRRTDSGIEALAQDHALLVQAMLDIFDATSDVRWFDQAIALQQRQDQLFWDASAGRYRTGTTLPEPLRGALEEADGTMPGVNATSALNLLRLATLTGNESWRSRPAVIFQSFGGRLRNSGAELPSLALALDLSNVAPSIVVVAGDPRLKETHDALRAIHDRWEPMRAVVFLPHKGAARERIIRALPFTGALTAGEEGVPITWTCAGGECRR